MRARTWPLVLMVVVACGGGGGDASTSTPTPVVEKPGAPAALVVLSGDAQEGEPGKPLATTLTVVVRDGSSRAVPGVTVSFAVESGGGTLERSSAVTGTDGTASPGAWRLGPTEGANSVRATVSSLAAVSARATAKYPVIHVAQSVAASGGSVVYSKAGDAMDGLRLDIPSGSFATASSWTLDVHAAATVPPVRGRTVRTPAITITTDQAGFAAHPLTLRIPVTLGRDSMLVAFLNDPSTGYLEPLPVAGSDAQSVTILARHLSSALLPAPPASLRTLLTSLPRLEPPRLRIITIAEATEKLASGPITSSFMPGEDDWEFQNNGSYVSPAGHVTGQSVSALRYFNTMRSEADLTTTLSGRFDQGPFWADNRLGVRVAALAETAVHWGGVDEYLQAADRLATNTGMNADQAHLITIAEALYITQQPQLVMLRSGSTSVALIAYQASLDGLLAADPANPGRALRIPFTNGRFQPVSVVLDAATGAAMTFGTVRAMGLSAIANIGAIDQRLAELAGGAVGTDAFPAYGVQYYDQNEGVWKEFTGPDLNVSWQDISLRATCALCARKLPNADPSTLTALDVYDGQARQLGSDRTAGRVDFTIPAGSNRVGLHILGGAVAPGSPVTTWRHVDFKYVRINSSRIFITPDPANTLIGQSITLTANNQGLPTASYRFLWSFDDDTPGVAIDGVNTVSHTYSRGGMFTARVIVKDPVTNVEIGRATSQVLVDLPVPVWRITSWRQLSASGPPASEFHDRAILQADALLYDVLLGNANRGMLFYLDQPLTVGNTTYNVGVHLQVSPSLPSPTGLDPNISSRSVARPQSAALFPNALDRLVVNGDLGAGDLTGVSVDTYWITRTCTSPGETVPWLTWSITAVKSGTTLTGRMRRVQRITRFGGGTGASCLVEFKEFVGDLVQEWEFTATRLR